MGKSPGPCGENSDIGKGPKKDRGKDDGILPVSQIEQELVRRAAAQGVAVYALSDYLLPGTAEKQPGTQVWQEEHSVFPDEEPGREGQELDREYTEYTARRLPAILLGFGALDEASIREGVRRLSLAL